MEKKKLPRFLWFLPIIGLLLGAGGVAAWWFIQNGSLPFVGGGHSELTRAVKKADTAAFAELFGELPEEDAMTDAELAEWLCVEPEKPDMPLLEAILKTGTIKIAGKGDGEVTLKVTAPDLATVIEDELPDGCTDEELAEAVLDLGKDCPMAEAEVAVPFSEGKKGVVRYTMTPELFDALYGGLWSKRAALASEYYEALREAVK